MVPCPSPHLSPNPLHQVSQMETSFFQISPSISTVPFLHFIRGNWSYHSPYTLSFPPSLPRSKPFTVVVSQSKGKFFLQCLWTPSTGPLSSLSCLSSKPLCKSIFGSAVCTLVCGSIVGSLQSFFASPSFRRGWVAPPINQVALKMKNNAVCFTDY